MKTIGGVALISVAESLDTASAAGRLVITIMAAVSPCAVGSNIRRGPNTSDFLSSVAEPGHQAHRDCPEAD
jgi:hypothetical protein